MQTTASSIPQVQPNILKTMQPQSAQNMYVQQASVNSSNQVRTANPTGSLFRGPPSSPAPRNGPRHVPMPTLYQQTMHQGVVVQSYPQYPRQAYPGQPYSPYSQPIQPNYSYSYPYYTVPAQRGAVGVNTTVGVSSTMSVQTGPNGPITGPPGATQPQIPLAPGTVLAASAVPPGTTSTVLGVAPSTSGQQVGISSMVSVVPTTVRTSPAAKPVRRLHRLEIIDPVTHKNILDDYDKSKNSKNSDVDYQNDQIYVQQTIVMATEPLQNVSYDMLDIQPMSQLQRDVPAGQTPVVSAMSDAPSVEILPTPKPKSKKIPIVNPKDEIYSTSNAAAQPPENLAHSNQLHQQQQQTAKTLNEDISSSYITTKSDCVQHQLPAAQQSQAYFDHQVPQISLQLQQDITTNTTTLEQKLRKQESHSDISQGSISLTTTSTITTPTNHHQQSQSQFQTQIQYKRHQNQIQQEETPNIATKVNLVEAPLLTPTSEAANSVSASDASASTSPNQSIGENANIAAVAAGAVNTDAAKTEIRQTIIANAPNVQSTMQLTEKENLTTTMSVVLAPVTTSNKELHSNLIVADTSNGVVSQEATIDDEVRNNNNNTFIDDVIVVSKVRGNNTNNNHKFSTAKFDENVGDDNSQCYQHLKNQGEIKASLQDRDETDRVLQHQPQSEEIIDSNQEQQKCNPKNKLIVQPNLIKTTMESSETKNSSSRGVAIPLNELGYDAKKSNNVLSSTTVSNITASLSSTTTLSTVIGTAQLSSQTVINYNEGQWSPNNPTGKKQYDREQLLLLREVKASRKQPEINNVSILPTPNLMPSFVRNPKRVQSMIGSLGGNRGGGGAASGTDASSSGGSYGSKQASMSGVHGRGSMKAGMIHVNLSLNQDVKLNETDNAWRPRVLVKTADGENNPEVKSKREKEELIRRVRGILNKLTPEKFDALVEEIIKLKIDTPDKMEAVMVLVFEKAIDEPNFSVSYARLCHRLILEVKAQDKRMESGTKTNLAHFRNALLDKTEREFTQNVTKSKAKEEKLQPIIDKIGKCTDISEKTELEAQLEEEERKIRRRSVGTVRFIGELFKISMLNGKIINSCIESLLNPNSEDMLECLCKLLTTVGAKFEQTLIFSKNTYYSLDKIIGRMQAIASKTDKEGAKVSSRVRFMLQDVIDLRRDKWKSKRNEAPKTMGQVEKEMKTEQLSSQYLNFSGPVTNTVSGSGLNGQSSLGPGGKRDDRGSNRFNDSRSGYGGSHSQRGDTGSIRRQQQVGSSSGGNNSTGGGHSNGSNDDSTWHVQTSKGSRCLDTNKLEALTTSSNFETKKMGGVSQFQWKSPAPAPVPPSNPFAALSSLNDTHRNTERDRDRDRSGPRNKGSYNKGSMERDRYTMSSRSNSSQTSRENSSSRGPQTIRGTINSSALPKSASHSKYPQQSMSSSNRMQPKPALSTTVSLSLYSQRVMDTGLYSTSSSQKQPDITKTPPLEAPLAVFEKSSDEDLRKFKSVVSEMLEVAINSNTLVDTIEPCIIRISENQRCALLCYIMTDYLHLGYVTKMHRRYLGSIVTYCLKNKFISGEHFLLAYKKFCEQATDLELDIPELWKYFIEFTGPLISKKYITIQDLWTKQVKEQNSPSFGMKFLKTFLDYCLSDIGPNFTRAMWKKLNVKWTDFMEESKVVIFIKDHKYEYLENESVQPFIVINEPKEEHINKIVENIEHLLKEGTTPDYIIDYINGNIVDNCIDKQFIRSLATKLCDFAISYTDADTSYKLDINCFQKICIPILNRFIYSKEERELECLYSMQLFVHHLEHPRSLLSELFAELYDADVIRQDSFLKWRDSKDQSAGKGVAVKGLNPFFNHVLSSETSDENN